MDTVTVSDRVSAHTNLLPAPPIRISRLTILSFSVRLSLGSVKGTVTIFSKMPSSLKYSGCLDFNHVLREWLHLQKENSLQINHCNKIYLTLFVFFMKDYRVHFVLAYYPQAWALPWTVVYTCCDHSQMNCWLRVLFFTLMLETPLKKTAFCVAVICRSL